jgi:hypothetical protein
MNRSKLILLLTMVPFALVAGVNNLPSASSAALSGAGCADAIGVRAVRYNPAGLGFLRDWESEFSHLPWAFGMASEGLGYASPFGAIGGLGVSASVFHSLFGADNVVYEQGSVTGALNNADISLGLAWGKPVLLPNLSVGLSADLRDRMIAGTHAISFGFGGGALYRMVLLPALFKDASAGNENFQAGISLNGLLDTDRSEPIILRSGILLRPWKFVALLCDLRYASVRNFYSDLDILAGTEWTWGFKFTKFFLRAGYSAMKNTVTCGAGAQASVGTTSYRFDYAFDLMLDPLVGSDLGRANWFSLVIAKNPVLLQLIASRFGNLPEAAYDIRDRIVIAGRADGGPERTAERETYEVRVGSVDVADPCLKSKSYGRELESFLSGALAERPNLRPVSSGGDLVMNGSISKEGDLMKCTMRLIDAASGAVLQENSFEKTVVCEQQSEETASALDLMVRKEGDRIVIVPREQGEEQDRELGKLKEAASEIGLWTSESARDLLSSEYAVQANYSNVDIYADGSWLARTDPDGRASIRLRRGERFLSFLRENTPRKEMKITASAGKKERLSVEMGEGSFTVPVEIASFSDPLKVSLDGTAVGTTPVKLQKVQNGRHVLLYTDSRGKQTKEELEIGVEGVYRITAVSRVNETFSRIDPALWNTVTPDAGITVGARAKRLEIKGSASDGEWNPSGIVSRPFQAGQLSVEATIRARDPATLCVIGIVDERGEGLGFGLDAKYGQIFESGRGAKGLVPALSLRDRGGDQNLKIVYRDGTVKVELNGDALAERSRKMTGPVRVFILADGERQGSGVDFDMRNLVVRNDVR